VTQSLRAEPDREANFQIRRATIAFDLAASIPADATITGATLRLFLESAGQNAGGTSVSLHELAADWGEGTSKGIVGNPGSASTGDATWLHRFYSTTFWSQPGGDFDTMPSATTTIEFPTRFYEWTGAGLLEDVQGWLVNPAANFGWILMGEEGDVITALRFDSRESTIPTNRPQLVVSYTVPEPSSVALLIGAAVAVLGLARLATLFSTELSPKPLEAQTHTVKE
jgi:hypothetical protein